jgi:hypothetical protein
MTISSNEEASSRGVARGGARDKVVERGRRGVAADSDDGASECHMVRPGGLDSG